MHWKRGITVSSEGNFGRLIKTKKPKFTEYKHMKFNEIKKLCTEIIEDEFLTRNNNLNTSILNLKGSMNARGILYSSITLNNLAEILLKEFTERIDFVSNLIIDNGVNVNFNVNDDLITEAKILFQEISLAQIEYIKNKYQESSGQIRDSLQSNIPNEIFDHFIENLNRKMHQNNSFVELKYKIIIEQKYNKKEILELFPKLFGIGIDLKELYKQLIEKIKHFNAQPRHFWYLQ